MAGSGSRFAPLVAAAVAGWILVGSSFAYLVWPVSDRYGRPCGSAVAPVHEPTPYDDDAYLDVCAELTTPRADIGWSLATASALLALSATGAALVSRRRRPWPAYDSREQVPPTAVS